MKKSPLFLTLLLLAAMFLGSFTPAPAAQAAPWQNKVDTWVLQTAERGETEFLVFLNEQADLSAAEALTGKLEKGRYVYKTLYDLAQRSQAPLLAALDERGAAHRSFYIANMVWVRGGLDVIEAMARRPDVARLYANPAVRLQLPQVEPQPQAPEAVTAVEWNILKTNADDVWAAGYTGQGVVIGGQDTGYDWDHPALKGKYRGWSGTLADHNYNWHDAIHIGGSTCGADSPVPCDDDSHGTHTMGTMAGDDGAGNQIGMAPGARWIGCRNMNNGVGTPTTYAECYEWFIAPYPVGGTTAQGDPSKAPDVINNSWGCPPSEGCTDPNVLLSVVNNVRSAGILTVHSAGNSGSTCSSVNEPAAIYAASFSVGATDSNDIIASFSSRGPVTIDGSNRLKPEISAPGVNIRSSVPGTTYQSGWSGTSMAGPHVAGMAALLMSAQPSLKGQVSELENIMEQTALPRTTTQNCGGVSGTTIPNNTYGWGRIDALAALQSLAHELTIQKSTLETVVAPGGLITYTLEVNHLHASQPTANVVVTDTLPAGVSLVSATQPYTLDGSVIRWDIPSMGPASTASLELVVQAGPGAPVTITNQDYWAGSDEAARVTGLPVSTSVVPYSLGLTKTAPAAVTPGALITYTLDVTNQHPNATQHNIILTDTLPAGTTFITATLPHVLQAGIVRWDKSSLDTERNMRVNLVVQAPAGDGALVTNQAYGVMSDETAFTGGPAVQTSVIAQSLTLNKTAPQFVQSGEVFTYTLAVQNPHPSAPASHLLLTDTLPSDLDLVRTQPAATLDQGMLSWSLPSLAAGATWQVRFVVSTPLTYTGVITNSQYGVRSDEVAVQSGPPVVTRVHNLGLEKSVSASQATGGELITYTLRVQNLHLTQAMTQVELTDVLPAGTAFVSSDADHTLVGNRFTWHLASLGAGQSWTVHLVVRVLPGASGSITNADYAASSLESPGPVTGPPVVTTLWYGIYLPSLTK